MRGETYPTLLNGAYTAFTVVQIDADLCEAFIVWTDNNAEEWAYMDDMKRWIDVD
ncbi:hypothetical protein [Paenibacillus sp. J2TS4]|uniref:hypothetical protein n=1 Tax=Paenibacillus sp. J2TS4 TaxID=2807194 RepID=UPI001B0B5007|nr:hypothetical protein [Paenibacillus sp. J2TS4]GIP33609.1 hypothetical protein J2TS4_28190 [Paenibacillus sp. J2TS4]